MNSSHAASSLAVTTSDHGALIVIVAVVGATWTILVYLIRLYIRLRLNGPFGLDDVAASFATVSTMGKRVVIQSKRSISLGIWN